MCNYVCKGSVLLALLSTIHFSNCNSEDSIIAQRNFLPNEATSKKFGEDGVALFLDEYNGFMDPKTFITHHAIPSVPVIMRNAAKHFPAYERWKTDDYFLSLDLSNEEFVVVETKKKENRSAGSVDMNFKDFVEIYNETNQYMVNSLPEFLGNDVILPWSLQCLDIIEDGIIDSVMWFSSGGTKSVVHTDSVDNINCVFSGNKTFVFVDPQKYWDEVPLDHPDGAYSGIDVDNVDYGKYPHLKDIEYHHVNMSAGDCIFIPYRWIHQVRSYGRNLAVNVWWDYHMNKNIDLDSCKSEEDPTITMNSANFIGFDAIMGTPPQIRDLFKEYARVPGAITAESLKSYILGNAEMKSSAELESALTAPIKRIMKALDVDLNGRVIVNEVLFASDEVWETVSKELGQSQNMIGRMAERLESSEGHSKQSINKDEL